MTFTLVVGATLYGFGGSASAAPAASRPSIVASIPELGKAIRLHSLPCVLIAAVRLHPSEDAAMFVDVPRAADASAELKWHLSCNRFSHTSPT